MVHTKMLTNILQLEQLRPLAESHKYGGSLGTAIEKEVTKQRRILNAIAKIMKGEKPQAAAVPALLKQVDTATTEVTEMGGWAVRLGIALPTQKPVRRGKRAKAVADGSYVSDGRR